MDNLEVMRVLSVILTVILLSFHTFAGADVVSEGKKLTFDEIVSELSFSALPTSNVTSIKTMFSRDSLH